jgi:predicted nucleic acid-binding protein
VTVTVKVFLDTNVLIDVLANREPFYDDAAAVWTLAEDGAISGQISVLSFTNTFYIVRRLADEKTARRTLGLLRDAFTLVACDGAIIRKAIDARFDDFEDAVQYLSAIEAGADCLVTRNESHFPDSGQCPVLAPAEFLAAHEFE